MTVGELTNEHAKRIVEILQRELADENRSYVDRMISVLSRARRFEDTCIAACAAQAIRETSAPAEATAEAEREADKRLVDVNYASHDARQYKTATGKTVDFPVRRVNGNTEISVSETEISVNAPEVQVLSEAVSQEFDTQIPKAE